MTPDHQLVWFLRATAITLLSAALAVVLPHAWMDAVHRWMGLGELPDSPIVGYLTRSISALYAAFGACYCHISGDVRRYLPLLRFSVLVTIGFAIVLVSVDVACRLPWEWTFAEAAFLISWCAAYAWLIRRVRADQIS
ncbi:MAG: hypothetical protein EXS16_00520 [Gemmataceae bacterium]|nr:hypothetical protein [Gemmataceae bacterium]